MRKFIVFLTVLVVLLLVWNIEEINSFSHQGYDYILEEYTVREEDYPKPMAPSPPSCNDTCTEANPNTSFSSYYYSSPRAGEDRRDISSHHGQVASAVKAVRWNERFDQPPTEMDTGVCCSRQYFSGGIQYGEPCSVTQCILKDSYHFPSYLCTTNDPEKNEISSVFENPLPPATLVVQVKMKLWGRFQCNPSASRSVIAVTLNEVLIKVGEIVPKTQGCTCANCVVPIEVNSNFTNYGVPNYHYGPKANNTLAISVPLGSICLSAVDVFLLFADVPPVVHTVEPQSGPISTEIALSVHGSGFADADQLSCVFNATTSGGDEKLYFTKAQFITSEELACSSPSVITHAQKVRFQVTENNITFSNGTTPPFFYFYKPARVYSLYPDEGPASGGTLITLKGQNFWENNLMKVECGFIGESGRVKTPAQHYNETVVICRTPKVPMNATQNLFFGSHRKQIKLARYFQSKVEISQNGQLFIPTNFTFSYDLENPSDFSSSPHHNFEMPVWGWTLIAIFVALIAIVVCVGVLVYRSKRIARSSRRLAFNEKSGLLSADGSTSSYGYDDTYTLSMNNIDLCEISHLTLIEKGSFGLIYKGEWEGTTIAVKKLPAGKMTRTFVEELQQEAAIMRRLRHPNVLNFLGTSTDNEGNQICIIMEYMDRGSLYRLIHDVDVQFTQTQIKYLCIDAARGMNYLHKLNPPIIHRDLKSHNLLLNSEGILKVCDFGLSRMIETTLAGTMTACGTPSWTAPEVLRNEHYDFKVDVFSFGVVVWELFARQDPYPSMPPFQIVFAVGNQGARPKINPSWPSHWIKLITDCWAEDPDERPTFDEIIEILKHFPDK